MTRLEQIQAAVEEKGFKLVDATGYQNQNSFVKVQCPHGHISEVRLVDFKKAS